MSTRLSYILVAFILLFQSCELAKLTDPKVNANVEDEFFINLKEQLLISNNRLSFVVSTIEPESCTNATIDYSFSRLVSGFKISIKEILIPADCIEGVAPAESEIDLATISNGVHQFDLDLKNTIKNSGTLEVTDEAYFLSLNSQSGIKILNATLYKIPQGTIWGYVIPKNEAVQPIAEQFLTELTGATIAPNLREGYYGAFRIGDNNVVAIEDQPVDDQLRSFVFDLNGSSTSKVIDLINIYRSNYSDEDLEIKLFDFQGVTY
ncbi:MAG: hypothetical protein AAFO07_18175 [Bacteroidota bacterium]